MYLKMILKSQTGILNSDHHRIFTTFNNFRIAHKLNQHNISLRAVYMPVKHKIV